MLDAVTKELEESEENDMQRAKDGLITDLLPKNFSIIFT